MREFARERPVAFRDLEVRVAGLARSHCERDQAIVGREVRVADAADVGRMVELAERPPLAARRHAVRVDGADAGVLQPLDPGVGVVGRVVDVRPVQQGRHAAVERLERPGVVADVDVFRAVMAAHASEHDREVMVERAAGEHTAHGRLPRVPVRVDESRHHDHPCRVDLLRTGRLETASDLDDLAVLDKHVAVRDVTDTGIHRDDESVLDAKPPRAHAVLLLGSTDMK